MNSTIYIFGAFENGFSQHPSDYASRILQHGASLTDAPTALIAHRDGALMYYSYIRRLETPGKKYYIGFCTVLNGIALPCTHELMDIYERLIVNLVKLGRLVRLDDAGRVVPAIKSLKGQEQVLASVRTYITRSLDQLEKNQQRLPPANYAVSDTHVERFGPDAAEADIAAAANKGGYIVVAKAAGFDGDQLVSYRRTVERLGKERDQLLQKNEELVASVRHALRKELRTRMWLIALLVLAVVAWCFIEVLKHLERTQEHLDTAVNTISGQRDRISGLNNSVHSLQQEIAGEQKARVKAEQELQRWRKQVGEYIPMLVLDVEVANVTEDNHIINDYSTPLYTRNVQYLKPRLRYIGIQSDAEAHLFVRLYAPDGQILRGYTSPEGYTYQQTVMVAEGEHQLPLMGWGIPSSQLRKGTYRFEFWHGHICLKALEFRLY